MSHFCPLSLSNYRSRLSSLLSTALEDLCLMWKKGNVPLLILRCQIFRSDFLSANDRRVSMVIWLQRNLGVSVWLIE